MLIRKAKTSDFEEYFRLETLYNKETATHEDKAFRCTSLDKSKIHKNFLKKVRKQGKLFLVLDDGTHLQGYFYGEISHNKMELYGYKHHNTKFGYIENTFITKNHRGKGFFKQYINLFLQYLKEKHIQYSELHVSTKNLAAIKIYEKYGFRSVEQRMRLSVSRK